MLRSHSLLSGFYAIATIAIIGLPCASFASVPCADLNPSALKFSASLETVGREAGLPGNRFSTYHRQVVFSLCANRQDRVDQLIDEGRVSAREVSAIRRVLVVSDVAPIAIVDSESSRSPAVNDKGGKAAHKPSQEEAVEIDTVVDQLFVRWAANWFTDRYIKGSAHAVEIISDGREYVARGSFSFNRYGAMAAIPFASTLVRKGNEFLASNLCYNDTTTNMTDCTSTGQSSAATRILGSVILAGIVAGAGADNSSGEKSGCDSLCSLQQTRDYQHEMNAFAKGMGEKTPYPGAD